ncbi:hypothetical protein NUW54_g8144 [Trametes sanguinea]|uniref:Uncharacterized protein n=1 Tax=Trametes sanguinea TaxID=158606 RepID=A0ACC1PG19_9APHY|nr:hypothetical protein NUW54_g8144 [Trametes sanguinea]
MLPLGLPTMLCYGRVRSNRSGERRPPFRFVSTRRLAIARERILLVMVLDLNVAPPPARSSPSSNAVPERPRRSARNHWLPGHVFTADRLPWPLLAADRFRASSSSLGVGLRPQTTGAAGAANPFRATMFSVTGNPASAFGGSGPGFAGSGSLLGSTSTNSSLGTNGSAFGASSPFSLGNNSTGAPSAFGTGSLGLGGAFGQNQGQQQQGQQQQGGTASLI